MYCVLSVVSVKRGGEGGGRKGVERGRKGGEEGGRGGITSYHGFSYLPHYLSLVGSVWLQTYT